MVDALRFVCGCDVRSTLMRCAFSFVAFRAAKSVFLYWLFATLAKPFIIMVKMASVPSDTLSNKWSQAALMDGSFMRVSLMCCGVVDSYRCNRGCDSSFSRVLSSKVKKSKESSVMFVRERAEF